MRRTIAVLAGIAVLAAVNWIIHQREQLIRTGAVARLELAPVDPRSLMQGDYMALRFQLAAQAYRLGTDRKADDGHIVVKADDKGVARYVRHDAGEALAPGELRMRYRVREGRVKFATNAWFFQEGHAKLYERARYGEFRVAPSGDMLLVNMLGEKLERLGPPG
ncbi:MAG: GDYXXLXY domain-containing protein [Betaproteobacteria bacterium]